MVILMVFLVTLVLVIMGFTIKTVLVVKNNNFNQIISYFQKYLIFIFVLLFILYVFSIVMSGVYLKQSELIFILFVKYLIHLVYFIAIFKYSKLLLTNLSKGLIFEKTNSQLTRNIGVSFIYLGITEIVSGLILSVIRLLMSSTFKEFRLETNTPLVLFLVIGLILLIVSSILEKAIKIHRENSLTI